jgi:hypothetical protein
VQDVYFIPLFKGATPNEIDYFAFMNLGQPQMAIKRFQGKVTIHFYSPIFT